jgi:hypothetical protein
MAQDEFSAEAVVETSAVESDRRRLQREECANSPWVRLLDRRTANIHRAVVSDFSAGGLGIRTDCYIAPGTSLIIELQNKLSRGNSSAITIMVRHSTAMENGDWLLGCTLSRTLTDKEMVGLGLGHLC